MLTAAVTGPLFCNDTSPSYRVGCSNPVDYVSPILNYKPRPDMHVTTILEGFAMFALQLHICLCKVTVPPFQTVQTIQIMSIPGHSKSMAIEQLYIM